MRVLVTTVPELGHVNPLIPLARGLRDAGHEVLWAVAEPVCRLLGTKGFAARVAGPPMSDWWAELARRARGRPADGIRPDRTIHWIAPRLFGDIGAALMVDDLLDVVRAFVPDVVLFGSRCVAVPPVARLVGALPVARMVNALRTSSEDELIGEAVTPLWRDLGLDAPVHSGVFHGPAFSAFPAVIDDASPYPGVVVRRLRPEPFRDAAPPWLAGWLRERAGLPLVYPTLGTVFGASALLRTLTDALAILDVAVLLTVGPEGDPDSGPRVRIERYVGQDALLPERALVVAHGGSGTLLGALAHGVPQVLMPQGADQFGNARIAEEHGFGRALLPPSVSGDDIADAVGRC